MRDDVSFADGLVQTNGPGYQALIVYQSEWTPTLPGTCSTGHGRA